MPEKRTKAEREDLGLYLERDKDWVDHLVAWAWLFYLVALCALIATKCS